MTRRLPAFPPPPGLGDTLAVRQMYAYLKALHETIREDQAATRRLADRLERAASRYTVSNGSEDRTFDADSITAEELADVVYSILLDLKWSDD